MHTLFWRTFGEYVGGDFRFSPVWEFDFGFEFIRGI
jgi:hypothetical protein